MKTCPQCGALNRPEARFCRQCQSVLPSVVTLTCPYCGAPLRAGARFCNQCGKPISLVNARPLCPHCGNPVRPQARFCHHCGLPLAPTMARKRCPNCGAWVRVEARFCPRCRTSLLVSPSPEAIVSHPGTIVSPSLPPRQQPGRFGTGDLLPLTVLADRYLVLEKIAQGGMGAIYRAQDKRLQDKIVAVKEMSEFAIPKDERKRVLESFQREAELLAQLNHPNLVRVTDRFEEDKRHYMVMEFITGRTLEEMLEGRTEPFPEEQVLIWAEQLCDVLFYLHSQTPKIIYRDVKPANVMVLDGSDDIKLIDFGIARFYKPGKKKDTIHFGTDGYAPPEQYGKAQTDERADIYALGVMLHQLLTLHDPTTTPFQFPSVRKLNPKVSSRVDTAIKKAVDKDKNKRHQSMEEMRTALLGETVTQGQLASGKKKKTTNKPTEPSASSPHKPEQLVSLHDSLDLGEVMADGVAHEYHLTVPLPAGEEATLDTDVPWLQIHPRDISKQDTQITVTLYTTHLEPGRLQLVGNWLKRWAGWHTRLLVPVKRQMDAHVEIELKSGAIERVPVSVTVIPQPWRVQAGWAITIGAMLLETAVMSGVLLILMVMMFQ